MMLSLPKGNKSAGGPSRLLVQGAVLSALVAGTVAYAQLGNSFGSEDLTSSAAAQIVSAEKLEPVSHAVTVTVDGASSSHSTTASTVGAAIYQLGLDAPGAATVPGRATPVTDGLNITVSTPKSVALNVKGAEKTVVTTASTVGDLLDEHGVDVAAADKLNVATDRPVEDGLAVKLTSVRSDQVTRTESVDFKTVTKKDSSLAKGTKKTVTKGVKGEREATYERSIVNGKVKSEKLVSSTTTRKPTDAVVAVGTKVVAAKSSSPSKSSSSSKSSGSSKSSAPATSKKSGGLNWAALAKCESSGNPRAVNPAGYYGLYQFSLSTWRAVGGSGNPANASPAEQTRRAQILFDRAGVGQWPHCGPRLFS